MSATISPMREPPSLHDRQPRHPLRHYRDRHNLRLADLAARAGMSAAGLSRIEAGATELPGCAVILALALATDHEVGEIDIFRLAFSRRHRPAGGRRHDRLSAAENSASRQSRHGGVQRESGSMTGRTPACEDSGIAERLRELQRDRMAAIAGCQCPPDGDGGQTHRPGCALEPRPAAMATPSQIKPRARRGRADAARGHTGPAACREPPTRSWPKPRPRSMRGIGYCCHERQSHRTEPPGLVAGVAATSTPTLVGPGAAFRAAARSSPGRPTRSHRRLK